MAIKPFLQAMWLADEVMRDETTGKVTVAGMFDHVSVQPPATRYEVPCYLFFALRNVHGAEILHLRHVHLSDNSVLREYPVPVEADSPLRTVDVALRMAAIFVPHPGEYAWELYWEDEMIGASRLTAEEQEGEDQNG